MRINVGFTILITVLIVTFISAIAEMNGRHGILTDTFSAGFFFGLIVSIGITQLGTWIGQPTKEVKP